MAGEDNPIFSRGKTPATEEEETMELMWEKGPVVVSSRSTAKRDIWTDHQDQAGPSRVSHQHQQHLYIQEDEMASWLHYNLSKDEFSPNLVYSAPPPPPSTPILNNPDITNLAQLSTFSMPVTVVTSPGYRELMPAVAESSKGTPAADIISVNLNFHDQELVMPPPPVTERTLTSFPPGSSIVSYTAPVQPPVLQPLQRPEKRKAPVEFDDRHQWNEEIRPDSEATEEVKGQRRAAAGSVSTKSSRKAQVHNLSERKRRNRINENIRTLQELIPGCNKLDQASILDDAIDHIKSLQMQAQMMSVGYGVMPMMYTGVQQYVPAIGMGMGMGMNRPIVPYPNILSGSMARNPADTGPRFSVPAFRLPQASQPDLTRFQASEQNELMLSLLIGRDPSQTHMPNFISPYQQFPGLCQAIISSQNQGPVQPSDNNPSSNVSNPENLNLG